MSGGIKYDEGKPMIGLIPPEAIFAIAKVLTYGANKYSPRNWEKGISYDRMFDAVQRHLWAHHAGIENDYESGLPHLWHALCGLGMLIALGERGMFCKSKDGQSDGPKSSPNGTVVSVPSQGHRE